MNSRPFTARFRSSRVAFARRVLLALCTALCTSLRAFTVHDVFAWCAVTTVMLTGLVAPRSAWAQQEPTLRTEISAEVVGLGSALQLTLKASLSSSDPISQPSIGATPGFTVLEANSFPSNSITIINGVRTDRQTLTATWILHASKLGTHRIGPPSVVVAGRRYVAVPISIRVVLPSQVPPSQGGPATPGARGGLPQLPPGSGGRNPFPPGFTSPFDAWKDLFKGFGDDEPEQAPEVPTDPKLALDAPRGEGAFLHAVIDKRHAVVGEQVTLSVYYYVDAGGSVPDPSDVHEPTTADFIKRSLSDDERHAKPVGHALVGGRLYVVTLVRKLALFPLKSGDLEIGPMSLAIATRRGLVKRQSETLHVRVTEPPAAKRPPGYTIGDVGQFELQAIVEPREIERDGSIAVRVELRGTGNLPSTLTPPEQRGVEWLEPNVREKLGAQRGDQFGGSRTFEFVVRVHGSSGMVAAEEIDLGEFALPFFNPESATYQVARAPLGAVRIKAGPGARHTEPNESPPERLAGLPSPKTERVGLSASNAPKHASTYSSDSPWFWFGLTVPALAYVVTRTGEAAIRRGRARRVARESSAEAELERRVAAATLANGGADSREADAATSRALEAATIAFAGVNVRGGAASAMRDELIAHGVSEARAHELLELLAECERARFAPDPEGMSGPRTRWERARTLISVLNGMERRT